MGQVLSQVQTDKKNLNIFDELDYLLEDIYDEVYINSKKQNWNINGLLITDNVDIIEEDPEWVYVLTDEVSAYSWLVEELVAIYNPKKIDLYRLLTTIGYLLNIYSSKYDDINKLFKIVTITSTVFLHPDHLGEDRFVVHPISLPTFGKEF